MRLKRATYRHIEAEIYGYKDTLQELANMRDNIILGGNTEIRPAAGDGYYGNSTVERRATRLADNVRIREMERIVAAIEDVIGRLEEKKRKALEWKYWGPGKDKPVRVAAEELGIDERELREWKRMLVYGVAAKLGWR